jgi:hypothetical protein
MLSEREVSAAIGGTAHGSDGEKLGTVGHFFVDDRTGAPSWVAVATGLFGTRHSIAPAVGATFAGGVLRLPVDVATVRDAPQVEGDHLGPDDETRLRRHYGLEPPSDAAAWTPTGEGLRPPGAVDDGPDVPAAPAAPVSGTRFRLVRYVVTEQVQVTVPIRREEVRVEEVPIDAVDDGPGESLVTGEESYGAHSARPALDDPGALPEEIVLHAERPVVGVEVVPVERVRLRTAPVQGRETVTGEVQRQRLLPEESPGAGPGA